MEMSVVVFGNFPSMMNVVFSCACPLLWVITGAAVPAYVEGPSIKGTITWNVQIFCSPISFNIDCGLFSCEAEWSRTWVPMFRRNLSPRSPG